MADNTTAPSLEPPPRRRARRWWLALGVAGLALAGWWFGVELPERRATAELKRKQAENALRIPDLNLDMVWIPPGTFRMGTPDQSAPAEWFYDMRKKITDQLNPDTYVQSDERPTTWVTLTQPFWLGSTEVTQAQWQAIMGSNPSHFKGADLPVEQVSCDDAMEFGRRLTERERVAGRLPKGHVYTLPTEAQWEYACRAGTTGDYAGDINAMAWYGKNSTNTTHPVGTKRANLWGLQDMYGNVWEWCLDWHDDYLGGEVTNPKGPVSGPLRVLRGGGWNNSALARSASRERDLPGRRIDDFGFRLSLAPAAAASPTLTTPAAKN